MKPLYFVLSFLCLPALVLCQDIGVNLKFDMTKEFKLNKKSSFKLVQKLQFNPELKNLRRKDEISIFNEIDLFPFDDDFVEKYRQEQMEKEDLTAFGELNDAPKKVKMETRSLSSLELDYKFNKSFSLGQNYYLALSDGKFRHLFRTEMAFRPKSLIKKVQFPQRLAFQLASKQRKGVTVFDHDLSARTGIEWKFKKKHELFCRVTANGAFDEKKWEWDRLRGDLGLEYAVTKKQSFELGYRFQKRLDKKRKISNMITIGYGIEF